MKNRMAMLVFLSIVFLVHFGVNYYIYRHTKPILSIEGFWGVFLKITFVLLVLSYPAGRFLERLIPSGFAEFVSKVGSLWLGAMLYLTLLFLLFDIARLILNATGLPSYQSVKGSVAFLKKVTLATYGVTLVIILAGYLNALYPRVSKLTISTNKFSSGQQGLRIGAASDIHLGTIISNGRLERFVRMMNEQKPDIILLAGDVFDEDLGPVIQNDMGKLLSKLNAPLGVYAVTGNHEYIGGVDPAIKYLEEHGVRVLRDTSMQIKSLINVVGRDDRQAKVMAGVNRKPLSELTEGLDKTLFTVMLDHQPYNLNEAVENGIDLQISGHTHHGQLFPLNFITKAIFEVSKGYKQIMNTHFYVSTGFGTWGPPVRVGNRPEVVVIDLVGSR